jgi:hypothetical protein
LPDIGRRAAESIFFPPLPSLNLKNTYDLEDASAFSIILNYTKSGHKHSNLTKHFKEIYLNRDEGVKSLVLVHEQATIISFINDPNIFDYIKDRVAFISDTPIKFKEIVIHKRYEKKYEGIKFNYRNIRVEQADPQPIKDLIDDTKPVYIIGFDSGVAPLLHIDITSKASIISYLYSFNEPGFAKK